MSKFASVLTLVVGGCLILASESARSGDPTPVKPGPAPAGVTHVDALKATSLVTNRDVVVLDVRTPEEFKAGHIAGATNVNLRAPDFEKRIGELDKNKIYLVHCAVGIRSTQCLPILQRQQLKTIIHLDGGLNAWQKASLPIEK